MKQRLQYNHNRKLSLCLESLLLDTNKENGFEGDLNSHGPQNLKVQIIYNIHVMVFVLCFH